MRSDKYLLRRRCTISRKLSATITHNGLKTPLHLYLTTFAKAHITYRESRLNHEDTSAVCRERFICISSEDISNNFRIVHEHDLPVYLGRLIECSHVL